MKSNLHLRWRFWFIKTLVLWSVRYFSKMMLPQNFLAFLLFLFSRVLQINISYPCLYWYCSPSSDSESSSESEKPSRLYFVFSLSISSSHCCLVLVMLRVLGLLACGLGKGFCCWSSPSFFWALQKVQLDPQPHFSSFWLEVCSPVLDSSFRGCFVMVASPLFVFCGQVVFLEHPISFLKQVTQHLACTRPWSIFSYYHRCWWCTIGRFWCGLQQGRAHCGSPGGGWPRVFLWCSPLSLLCGVTFSNIRIDFWKWGPKLADWCWDSWSHLVFHF